VFCNFIDADPSNFLQLLLKIVQFREDPMADDFHIVNVLNIKFVYFFHLFFYLILQFILSRVMYSYDCLFKHFIELETFDFEI
jgi:hypothetical protein